MEEVAAALAAPVTAPSEPPPGASGSHTSATVAPRSVLSRRALLGGGVLAVAAIAGGLKLWRVSGHSVAYTIEAQKMRNGEPLGDAYPASSGDTFEGGWRFRLRVRSPEAGFVYLINEGTGDAGAKRLWVLYPPRDFADSAVPDKEVLTGWYFFDQNPGTEKLWIVWSGRPVRSIDEPLGGSVHGEVKDPAQAAQIRLLLDRTAKPAEPGPGYGFQIRAAEGVLTNLVELRHK